MKPFYFFVATKEVGAWGLVSENKKHKNYYAQEPDILQLGIP